MRWWSNLPRKIALHSVEAGSHIHDIDSLYRRHMLSNTVSTLTIHPNRRVPILYIWVKLEITIAHVHEIMIKVFSLHLLHIMNIGPIIFVIRAETLISFNVIAICAFTWIGCVNAPHSRLDGDGNVNEFDWNLCKMCDTSLRRIYWSSA